MGRSSEEGSRRRRRSTMSEAAESKMAPLEEGSRRLTPSRVKSSMVLVEGSRRRRRSTISEAAESKMAPLEEGSRRLTPSRVVKSMVLVEGSRRSTHCRTKSMALEEEEGPGRLLNPESEEDLKALMMVKSEEGKILKLKKEYMAASKAGLVLNTFVPTVKAAQPAGKKTKKVVVKRLMRMTKPYIDFARAMAARPCPTRIRTEDELARLPKSSQYVYHQSFRIRNTRLAYVLALVDQQEKFGFAVDESEAEVTDDDEGDDILDN